MKFWELPEVRGYYYYLMICHKGTGNCNPNVRLDGEEPDIVSEQQESLPHCAWPRAPRSKKKRGTFLFHLCPFPSVPWSEQQTLTAGRRRGIWGKGDLWLARGFIESCQQWGMWMRYQNKYAMRTFFFILLILVIIGSSHCLFSHLYLQHNLQVDGTIKQYRMVRKMTEL